MKAWRLNEYDWYAAESFEEAVTAAIEHTGESREHIVDPEFATGTPETGSKMVWDDESQSLQITVAQAVEEMDGPGYCFGSEW